MELTPTEKRFLDVLSRYEALVPESAHIVPEGREERMRRAFAFSTLPDVNAIIVKLTDVMMGLADVVEGISKGGMRGVWVPNIRYIIKDVGLVADIIHSIAEDKLH
jgi:hypothetical protein